MERSDFETSVKRAQFARSHTRVDGSIITDFKWVTGRWKWWPDRTTVSCKVWNEQGGPALTGLHRKTYWLCVGWSRIEVLQGDNPVDVLQNGGKGDGGA